MRIIYTPPDGDKVEWIWKPGEVASAEAESIEEATGWDYPEFVNRFLAGSMRAKRALLWSLLRREQPRLQFGQVSFAVQNLYDEFDEEEIARAQAALAEQAGNEDDPVDDAARQRVAERLAEETGVEPGKDTGADDAPDSGT